MFTLEELIAKGISEDVAKAIIASYQKALEGKVDKVQFDTAVSERDGLKTQLAERDTQIGELSKFKGTNEELQTKLKQLEADNTEAANKYKEDLDKERKNNAIKLALLNDEFKPQDMEIVCSLIDVSKIHIDEKGSITAGFKEQHEALKKDRGFLFSNGPGKEGDPGKGDGDTKGEPNQFSFFGSKPKDGDKTPGKAVAGTFGSELAATRIKMMGGVPSENKGGD